MKQFYALFVFLITFTPAFGSSLVLSNSENFTCGWTIKVTTTPQTKCKQTLLDGAVSAQAYIGNQKVEGLHYTWYYSGSVTQLGTGQNLTMLEAGSYYVEVKNPIGGCIQRAEATVEFKGEKPWFVVEHVENVLTCNADPYGVIKMRSLNKWKSVWFRGDQVLDGKGITICMSTDICDDIPPGTYTIVYEDPSSGCRSDPYTLTVEGWPTTPVVNAAIIADTTCSGTGSGSLSLTAVTPPPGTEPPTGYTYVWRNSNGVVLSQFANKAIASPLAAGAYTVEVKGNYSNPSLACGTTVSYTVPHQPIKPEVSATATPNTICAPPTGGSYTGIITASATYKGQTVTNFSNYTFTWTDANGKTGSVTGTNKIEKLNGGTYTVTARHVTTGCTSNPYTVEIKNQLPVQTLTLTPVAQTNCISTAPNGSITASYSITPANTSTPNLKWYRGTTAGTTNQITTGISGNKLSDLAGGQTYTVVATDPGSGCQITTSVVVPLQQGVVIIKATPTPNTVCAPSTSVNGSISISELRFNNTIVTDFTGYTFSWYKGSSTTPIAGQSSATLTGQAAGVYRVSATRTDVGCTSDPVTVEIVNQLPVQTLTLTPVAQTNCISTALNGSITASYSITPANTSTPNLKWYRGTTAGTTNQITTGISGNKLSDLAGGQTYTVVATDPGSGCQITTSVVVPLQQGVVIIKATPTPNTVCAPSTSVNGSISISELRFNNTIVTDFTGYTFSWYKGSSTTPIAGQSSATLTGQAAGVYRVSATRTDVGCTSDPVTVEIVNQLPVQTLTLTPVAQTNCISTAPNGSITASYSITPANTSTPNLKWYRGTTAGTTNQITTGISGNKLSDLAGGQTYTVVATDPGSGCQTITSVVVPLQPVVIGLKATPTPNSTCPPTVTNNGSITVTEVTVNNQADTDLSNYTFSWFSESAGSFTQISGATGKTLSGRAAGKYQVSAKHNTLQCISDPITVEILEKLPAFSLSLTPTAQTNCGGTPNGAIAAIFNVNGADLSSGYSLKWYKGNAVIAANEITSGVSNSGATALTGNETYTVEASHATSGCKTVVSVYVPLQQPVITLDATPFNNAICAPVTAVNGRIEVTQVRYNGNAATGFSDYTFSWFKETAGVFSPIAVSDPTSNIISGQAAGRYQVRVTHKDLLCASNPVTVEIKDELPVLNLTLTPAAQTNCKGTPNGSISASYTINPASSGSFGLKWYKGNAVIAANEITSGVSNSGATALAGNETYTVVATDAISGCQVTSAVYVPLQYTVVTLKATATENKVCAPDVDKNGSIKIDEVYLNGTLDATIGGYTFAWYKEVNGTFTLISTETGATLSGQAAGRYQVVATHGGLLCSSSPVIVEIKDLLPVLSLDLSPKSQTSCNNIHNGEITATLNIGGSAGMVTTDYTLEWFDGSDTSTPLTTATINGNIATNIEGGRYYTVRATHNTSGCQTVAAVYVPAIEGTVTLTYGTFANKICNPAYAATNTYDGRINITSVLFNGVAQTDLTKYNFTWYKESSGTYSEFANGPALSSQAGLAVGSYQVEVTNISLGCISNRVTIKVEDNPEIHTIELTPTTQIACNAPFTGALAANVQVNGTDATMSDYSFEWFTGTSASGAAISTNLSGINGSTATKLASGYYTLRVINTSTGCVATKSIYLEEKLVVPSTQLAVQNITSCDPDDKGFLTASVFENGVEVDYNRYTFRWYKGKTATGTAMADTTQVLDQENDGSMLFTGYYTVVATNLLTRCSAAPQTQYLAPPPPLYLVESSINRYPTDCNEDAGVITAWVNEGGARNVSDYTFVWYMGRPTNLPATFYSNPEIDFNKPALDPLPSWYDPAVELVGKTANIDYYLNGATLFGREAGVYTVVITRKGDNCSEYRTIELPYDNGHQALKIATTDSESCDPVGVGSAVVQATDENGVPEADQGEFIFYLFEGTNPGDIDASPALYIAKQSGVTGQPTTTFTSLAPGFYTFLAQETATEDKCKSISKIFEIKQIAMPPVVNAGNITPSTMCDGGNGTASLTVGPDNYEAAGYDDNGNPVPAQQDYATTLFRITWTSVPAGADPASQIPAPAGIHPYVSAGTYPLTGLPTGTYEGYVTGNTGCDTPIKFFIPSQPPVITAVAAVTHQTNCYPENGTITITSVAGGATTDLTQYNFKWMNASGAEIDNTITGPSINNLAAGTYYVVATQKQNTGAGSGCNSAPVEVMIQDISIDPTVELETDPNTSCDPTFYTGAVRIKTPPTGDFSYEWFLVKADGSTESKGTGDQDNINPIANAAPGLYRIVVEAENGCKVEAEIQVGEQIIVPVITKVTATPQTSCNAAVSDASITVEEVVYDGITYTAPFTGFTFEWKNAGGIIAGASGPSIPLPGDPAVAAGTYRVEAFRSANPHMNCHSAPFTIEVPREPIYPSIQLSATANESCDAAAYTGSVSATVADLASGTYTYKWFKDGVDMNKDGDESSPPALTAMGPGLYKLVLTEGNGCPVEAEITLPENLRQPLITASATPQTNCVGGNGSITVGASFDGLTPTAGEFTFSWYNSQQNLASNSPFYTGTETSRSGLVAGTYYITASRTINPGMSCPSAPVEVIVPYTPLYPTVELSATANKSCDAAAYTGSVSATVADLASGTYTYKWFKDGVDMNKDGDESTPPALTAMGPGLYKLVLTEGNGCPVEAEITLPENLRQPLITANATPQTNCVGGNSTITVGASFDGLTATAGEFTFRWYSSQQNLASNSPFYTGTETSRSGLLAGTYYITASRTINPGMSCPSAPVEVKVLYEPIYPSLQLSATANESCDAAAYTGSVSATVADLASGTYTYKWFKDGVDMNMDGDESTPPALTAMGPGLYKLVLTEGNGCPVEAEITLPEDLRQPLITANATPQTNCVGGNGSITVGASFDGLTATAGEFTFRWYSSQQNLASNSPFYTGTETSRSGLLAGTYYITASRTINPGMSCPSAPVEVKVLYEPIYPSLQLSATANESCDAAAYTGSVSATVADLASGTYTYKWFKDGVDMNMDGDESTPPALTAMGPGLYKLVLTEGNGCPVEAEITLPENLRQPLITANATPQTNCVGGNGTITVGASFDGLTATAGEFTFSWYNSQQNLASNAPFYTGTETSRSSLVAGTYYITASRTINPGMSCPSAPVEVKVLYEPIYPSLQLSATANESCDAAAYTGSVSATVANLASGTYTYKWFKDGVDMNMDGDESTPPALTAMGPGLYKLVLTEGNGCPVEAEITLPENLRQPLITANATPQTNCVGGNGSITVGASFDGLTATAGEFTFRWYSSQQNLASNSPFYTGTETSRSGLLAGTYYITASRTINPGMSCPSAPVEVKVLYEPYYPAVALTASTNNTSCNAEANGSFSATITNFGSNYSYVLYKSGVATGLAESNINRAILSFTKMEEGEYKLMITAENSCPLETIITLVKEEVSSSLLITATDQTICNSNGTITATEVNFGGQVFSGADILLNFSLSLLDENSQVLNYTATGSAAGAQFNNLPAGVYMVKATRLQPAAGSVVGQGCSVTYVQAISDVSVAPAIEVLEYNMISACFGNPKGLIQVAVDGMTTNPSNYTASWEYRRTLDITDPKQSYPGTGFRLTNLDPGFYTITTKDNTTGCTNSFEFEISEVVVDIAINASANDQTYCQPLDNGELFVRVVNQEEIRNTLGFLPKFDFEVYAGEWATPPSSDYKYDVRNASQFSQLNVSTNTYTVFAWFNGHLVCLGSDNAFVGYVDNTPMPTAQAEAYLTICDPERPNASASASVNGITDGYTFTWYKETIALANKHHQDGPVVTELSEGKYVVEVYSTITGCIGYTEVEVSAQFPDVPFVDAMLTATASTSCAAPNGSLEVNVVNRDGFNFTWYRGETADAAMLIPNGPLPYRQDNLAEGTYTVVATDKANGCISNAVSKELGGDYTYPVYDIVITPANCSTNGTARVVDLSGKLREYYIYRGTDTNGTPLADHNSGTFSGIAGTYTLKVVSEDGCDQTRPFEITDVVAPFNGVTANGDGDNDYFHLACIDLFPQNLVRIYNRAGGLVFEMSGYDNSLRVFDGTGNRGLYLGNKQLPAGTYYWVLFRDYVNEKPKTGFLELIR
jgi:hypothetical protein